MRSKIYLIYCTEKSTSVHSMTCFCLFADFAICSTLKLTYGPQLHLDSWNKVASHESQLKLIHMNLMLDLSAAPQFILSLQ